MCLDQGDRFFQGRTIGAYDRGRSKCHSGLEADLNNNLRMAPQIRWSSRSKRNKNGHVLATQHRPWSPCLHRNDLYLTRITKGKHALHYFIRPPSCHVGPISINDIKPGPLSASPHDMTTRQPLLGDTEVAPLQLRVEDPHALVLEGCRGSPAQP